MEARSWMAKSNKQSRTRTNRRRTPDSESPERRRKGKIGI
jgi:hypothetical protein